jgi:hypothetical protein
MRRRWTWFDVPPAAENIEPQVIRNTGQVSVKPRLQFRRNQITALFGAEDAMNEIGRVCMRHEKCRP